MLAGPGENRPGVLYLARPDRSSAVLLEAFGVKFPAPLAGRIASASGGVPRLINRICTSCLLYSAARGEEAVTEATLSDVLATEIPGLPCGSVSKGGGRS